MKAGRTSRVAAVIALAISATAYASPPDTAARTESPDTTARTESTALEAPHAFSSRTRTSIESLDRTPIASRLEFAAPRRVPLFANERQVSPFIFEVRPPAGPDRVGIGHTWSLGGGRTLILDLTPSPLACAPYASITF